MRKFTLFLAATALTAVFALPAFAAPTATQVRAHSHWFAGSVTAVGTSSITVAVLWTGPNDGALNNQSVTLTVAPTTRIVGGKPPAQVALSTIQTGDLVGVRAVGVGSDLTTLTALRIRVNCNCHWIGGTIASTSSTGLTVQVKRTGPYDRVLNGQSVTLGVSSSTIYIQGKAKTPIALSDLTVGESVGVVFSASGFFKAPGFDPSTATFTAARVHVWGHGPVPSASSDVTAIAPVSAT
jgi:hypothetical protein